MECVERFNIPSSYIYDRYSMRIKLMLTFVIVGHFVIGQTANSSKSSKTIDTLVLFYGSLNSVGTGQYIKYLINNKPTDRETFYKFKKTQSNIVNCKPCFLKRFDANENLIMESLCYGDLPFGIYTTFYPNGNVKIRGKYNENNTGDWTKLIERGFGKKEGTWIYYDENGNILKTEKYSENKLID